MDLNILINKERIQANSLTEEFGNLKGRHLKCLQLLE